MSTKRTDNNKVKISRKSKKPIDYRWIDTLTDEEKNSVIKFYHRIFKEKNIEVDISDIKEIKKS